MEARVLVPVLVLLILVVLALFGLYRLVMWWLWREEVPASPAEVRADALQRRVNEQHELLAKQSDLWNADRHRKRLLRILLGEAWALERKMFPGNPTWRIPSDEELDKLRMTEYGRQVVGP